MSNVLLINNFGNSIRVCTALVEDPIFDIQVLKFIRIHGNSSISPYPLQSLYVTIQKVFNFLCMFSVFLHTFLLARVNLN